MEPNWNKRGHSLVWLEYWSVTPKVAGSSPVVLVVVFDAISTLFIDFATLLVLESTKSLPIVPNC